MGNSTAVKADVVFLPISSWQSKDCMTVTNGYLCKNNATLEAVYSDIAIRCCNNDVCKAKTANLVRKLYDQAVK